MKEIFRLFSLKIFTIIPSIVLISFIINCAVKVKKEKPKCKVTECPLEYGLSEDDHKPIITDECDQCHEEEDDFTPKDDTLYSKLQEESKNLCFECHEELMDKKYIHEPVKDGCRYCHILTESDIQWLLRDVPGKICYSCHDELFEKIAKSMYIHTPVKQNDCSACHEAHSSNNARLLKKPFPENSFVPYKAESYALCFECHSEEIASEEIAKNITRFRNGDNNLHNRHVNKLPKGRSCNVCHDPHAGTQPMNIIHVSRDIYPGSRPKSFEFLKYDTGGKCLSGCHKVMSYDRKNPIDYK